jgi:hypothetical protein
MPDVVSQAFVSLDLQLLRLVCRWAHYLGTRTVRTSYPAGKLLF